MVVREYLPEFPTIFIFNGIQLTDLQGTVQHPFMCIRETQQRKYLIYLGYPWNSITWYGYHYYLFHLICYQVLNVGAVFELNRYSNLSSVWVKHFGKLLPFCSVILIFITIIIIREEGRCSE